MKPRVTIQALAKKLCDAERRKKPHLRFFLVDGPCKACVAKARARLRTA